MLEDYYQLKLHTRHKRERKVKDSRGDLPYFYGKEEVDAYLDWEMKVEQLFACHQVSEERKGPLATLRF